MVGKRGKAERAARPRPPSRNRKSDHYCGRSIVLESPDRSRDWISCSSTAGRTKTAFVHTCHATSLRSKLTFSSKDEVQCCIDVLLTADFEKSVAAIILDREMCDAIKKLDWPANGN